jgi:hypothetical protein
VRGRPGPTAGPEGLRRHPGRVRRDRHGGGRRGHPAAHQDLQRHAGDQRGAVPARDPGDLQAGHRVPRLEPSRRPLHPPVRHVRRAVERGRLSAPLGAGEAGRARGRAAAGLFLRRGRVPGERLRIPQPGRQVDPLDLRLRLPFRRQPLCRLPAPVVDGAGRQARRGPGRRHRPRHRLGPGARPDPEVGRDDPGRPLHRLHRLPLAAAGRTDGRGLAGLGPVAALRPRPGRAVQDRRRRPDALHPGQRGSGRLALAHPAAAPHRQRLRVRQRLPGRGPGARDPAGQAGRRGAGRAPAAAVQGRSAGHRLERQCRGHGPGQRLPGASGIDQHLPDPGRRDRPGQPDADAGRGRPHRPPAGRRVQPAVRDPVRPGPRLSHPALPRQQPVRRAAVGPCADHGHPRQPGRQDGAVRTPRRPAGLQVRPVLARQLAVGAGRPGPGAPRP